MSEVSKNHGKVGINSNDFRLGNLMRIKGTNRLLAITILEPENIACKILDEQELEEDWVMEPIPIKGLVKKIERQYNWVFKFPGHIKHLHQLQNWFYASSGKEMAVPDNLFGNQPGTTFFSKPK